MTILPWRPHQWRYTLKAYGYLLFTFFRRVVWGRDPYWRRYFWNRWGYFPKHVLAALRGGPVVWIDAISGGEVTQLVSFCRLLRTTLPGYRLLLSTNNRYSYEFAATNLSVDAVIDSPWDCQGSVSRALSAISPVALIAVENLTSPRLFREAWRRGITTLLVSGLMSKNFHLHPMLQRTMEWRLFGWLDWIGAKSEEDARGFIIMGARPDRVVVTGNMKFDVEYLRVTDEQRAQFFDQLGLDPDRRVLLAASLHPGEERFVGEAFLAVRQEISDLDLVLVPRYQFHIDAMEGTLRCLGLSSIRKTMLGGRRPEPGQVVIVDTFGVLSRLYTIATVVFMGGSTYPRNVIGLGQNIVEPLVHRVPIFFGLYMNLWRDITEELKKVWPGVEVTTAQEFAEGLSALLKNPELMRRLRDKADEVMCRHGSDVQRNVDLVLRTLDLSSTGLRAPC